MTKKVAEFNGLPVCLYTITNSNGLTLSALNYGAAITALEVPDKSGKLENVIVNYNDFGDYEENPYYLGVIAGRTAGRTKYGVLEFNGETYQLDRNDGNNHLHGGKKGLSKRFWDTEVRENKIVFTYFSPDGEDGYPGNVTFKTVYELTEADEFVISYEASADRATPVNITNHAYFNLSGDKKQTILDHHLKIDSSVFYELDSESIPVGKLYADEHAPFDFRKEKTVRESVESSHGQIDIAGGGIDHPFLLDGNRQDVQISLSDKASGRIMEVKTDDPAVVIYSGNQIGAEPLLNNGSANKYDGICIETQKPPNETESYVITPDKKYSKKTVFSFSVRR